MRKDNELTIIETAIRLGVSTSRVSQLIGKGLLLANRRRPATGGQEIVTIPETSIAAYQKKKNTLVPVETAQTAA